MRKILFSLLFLLMLCRLSYAGAVSVSSFLTADDVTVAHLETMRSTFQGAINSADGALLQSATVTSAKLDANTNPENRWDESFNDYVYTGLLPPTSASLASTTTAGTAYVKGARVVKDATANTYTASKHTYVDLSNTGTYTYSEVEINASASAVAANSIRLALVSTDSSTVLSVTDKRVRSITTLTVEGNSFNRAMDAASGNVAYTGLGFTPSAIMFLGGVVNSSIITYCGFQGVVGTADAFCVFDYHGVTANTQYTTAGAVVTLAEATGKTQEAYVKSYDADGFTLTWTRTGTTSAGTATISYIAFR